MISEGIEDFFATLARPKSDAAVTPLNVLQLECADLGSTHSVGVQQQDHSAVASAYGCRAVDTVEGLVGTLFGDVTRELGQPVAEYFGNRLGQMSHDIFLLCAEGEEGSQGCLNLPP